MDQLRWHNYSGESADEIFQLVGSCRPDSLVVAFEMALGRKAADVGIAALSQPERDVLAIEALEREVNNGGYGQFFLNSSNMYADQVVDALRRIACPATAAVTERAIAALGLRRPPTAETVAAAMEHDDEKRDALLEECDQAYLASRENIAQQLLAYLLRQRDAVRFTS